MEMTGSGGSYRTQRVLATGFHSNNNGLRFGRLFIQKENATLHADGTLLGPITNLHFAARNFPAGLISTLVQIIESSITDSVHPLRQLLPPINGVLHMEGDLRGSLAKPECIVQIRLLDGAIGGIDLGRAEIVASVTPTSRFLFNANFEPAIQSGHVHIQGSIRVTYSQIDSIDESDSEREGLGGPIRIPVWSKESDEGPADEISEEKLFRDKTEEGWDIYSVIRESQRLELEPFICRRGKNKCRHKRRRHDVDNSVNSLCQLASWLC